MIRREGSELPDKSKLETDGVGSRFVIHKCRCFHDENEVAGFLCVVKTKLTRLLKLTRRKTTVLTCILYAWDAKDKTRH